MERKILTAPCEGWVGGDSFVQMMDVAISGIKSDLNLEIYVMNLHAIELIGIEFEITFFDSAGNTLNPEPQIIKSENISIPVGTIGRASKYPLREFSAARKALVRLLKGHYADGNNLDLVYERMEKIVFNSLDDKEKELIKKALGDDAYTLARREATSWRCICGYFNGYPSKNCSNCARSQELVLQKYSDFTSILALLDSEEEKTEEPGEEPAPPVEEIPVETPSEKSILQFFEEIPSWILALLFVSGTLLISSLVIVLMNLGKK